MRTTFSTRPSPPPWAVVIAGAAIVLVLSGCATGGAASGTPPTPTVVPTFVRPPTPSPEPEMTFVALDACAILDHKAAQKIAQTPLETGQPGNPLSPSCLYTGPITGPLAQVQIFIGDGAKKTYDIDVQLKHVFKPVAGVGEEAYEETNAIFFRKGTTWVAIELVRLNDPSENVAPLQEVAKAAVLRLG